MPQKNSKNPAKYGTVGPLKEVNFHRCGRIGKVSYPPLRTAKRSCVRSKSHPIADEERNFGKFENLSKCWRKRKEELSDVRSYESCPTSDVCAKSEEMAKWAFAVADELVKLLVRRCGRVLKVEEFWKCRRCGRRSDVASDSKVVRSPTPPKGWKFV